MSCLYRETGQMDNAPELKLLVTFVACLVERKINDLLAFPLQICSRAQLLTTRPQHSMGIFV